MDIKAVILSGKETITILPYQEHLCHSLSFKTPFTEGDYVRVQLSYHQSVPTYEAVVGWVERVNASSFEACVATSGPIRPRREVTVQWLAYDAVPSQGKEGVMDIPLWTTGTECVTVDLSGQVSSSNKRSKRGAACSTEILWHLQLSSPTISFIFSLPYALFARNLKSTGGEVVYQLLICNENRNSGLRLRDWHSGKFTIT